MAGVRLYRGLSGTTIPDFSMVRDSEFQDADSNDGINDGLCVRVPIISVMSVHGTIMVLQ